MPEKAYLPIETTESGISTLVNCVLEKALLPIEVTESGIVILLRDLASLKVKSPIEVTPLGMVILVKELALKKAPLPIDVTEFGIVTLVKDFASLKASLPIGDLLNNLQENDILITCEISRLGRSLLEVMKILETCLNKNCQVWTLKENYRLGNDIQSKVLAFAFGLAAEIERNLISERTKSSLANIKASGKKLGRPLNAESKKLKLSKNTNKIRILLKKGLSKAQIARILGVNRSTVRHFIDRFEAQVLPVA